MFLCFWQRIKNKREVQVVNSYLFNNTLSTKGYQKLQSFMGLCGLMASVVANQQLVIRTTHVELVNMLTKWETQPTGVIQGTRYQTHKLKVFTRRSKLAPIGILRLC